MAEVSQPRVYCFCKYMCAQSADGYKLVSKSTRTYHLRKDKIGEVYQNPHRANHTSNTQGGLNGLEVHQEGLDPIWDQPTPSRLAKCTCPLCGEAGLMIPRVTQRRHMAIYSWTERLRVQHYMGHNDDSNLDMLQGDQIATGMQTDFVSDENSCDESPLPTPDLPEENDAREESEKVHCLDDAILETVIELFSVLDHHKVSIACQKKVLKILFRDLSKNQNVGDFSKPENFRGLSLARLFNLAGSEWKGGIHGMAAPRTWNRLMEIYRMNGMVVPEKWLMCTGRVGAGHTPVVLRLADELELCPIEECGIVKSKMCEFSYLPLAEIFSSFFQSQTFCHEILYMWRNRSQWLPNEGEDEVRAANEIDEFWHGSKLKEYTNFWDPRSEWQLPLICPDAMCRKAYRLWPSVCEELEQEENFNNDTGFYHFPCVDCSAEINQRPVNVKGSPFNIALMGHWDGFQAASTVQKDCWTVEVVILNGGKRPLPNSVMAKPIPLLFIPMSSMKLQKHKKYHILQAFLKPMWNDFQTSFVHGFPIKLEYPFPIPELPYPRDEKIVVRVIVLKWTGDGPAQCKIGGTLLMGYNGCRRDVTMSESVLSNTRTKTKVVYSHNRKQARIKPRKRDIEGMHYYGKLLREAATNEAKAKFREESGLSHYSDMWLLYDLYGFNISLDLVNDPMHCLALGVLKSFNDRLLRSCDTLGVKQLMRVLQHVTNNRPIGLGARWPRLPLYVRNISGTGSKWKFSHYKAEEHLLFTVYCAAPILEELGYTLATPLGAEGAILIQLSRLFYSVSRKHGWTKEMLENARLHSSAWRVLTEEEYGVNGRIVEHVVGNGEILDDIERHGHHDIFWCYGFERMVSGYNSITTNGNSSEISYAQYFCRHQFSELFTQLQQDKDGFQRDQRTLYMLQHSLYPRIVGLANQVSLCAPFYSKKVSVVTSIENAMHLWTLVKIMSKPEFPSVQAIAKGIGIGPKKCAEVVVPHDDRISYDLQSYWFAQNLLGPSNCHLFRRRIEILRGVVVDGVIYRKNDLVVVENHPKEKPSLKCKIRSFFLHEFDGYYQIFFDALWCKEATMEGDYGEKLLLRTETTDMTFILEDSSQWHGDIAGPISKLLHRFMLHPTKIQSQGERVLVAYEFQDSAPRTHLLMPGKPGCCPPWPISKDVVLVAISTAENNTSLHLAYIITVHDESNRVDCQNSQKKVKIIWLGVDHSSGQQISNYEVFKVNLLHHKFTLLWRNILKVLDTTMFERIGSRRPTTLRWKAPKNWADILLMKRDKIQDAPALCEPYNESQYLT